MWSVLCLLQCDSVKKLLLPEGHTQRLVRDTGEGVQISLVVDWDPGPHISLTRLSVSWACSLCFPELSSGVLFLCETEIAT